ILKAVIYERGLRISLVYKENILDHASFISAYIKTYDEWLLYFIEKLEQRINIIINSFKETNDHTRKKHTSFIKWSK
ncbi:TPA: hypothetical protein R4423_001877, partial [Campylobacter jejuni]|nr:hypothetical protein [Campylobacter jejuni]HED4585897.1 hypothetical protein [Campylobacter jejuni]